LGDQHFDGVTVQPMVDRTGYEIILGSTLDEQFGPIILFGTGGQLVEVFCDRAVALPPLNATLARRLMRQTSIYKALLGTRGLPPADLPSLERTLIGFSDLLIEQPRIKECDINPLLVSPDGVLALDARIVLHPPTARVDDLPRPAIRPYPSNYIRKEVLHDGTNVRLRPIRLEDEPLMVKFHETLSDLSVHKRYCYMMALSHRTEHERLIRVCYNDYDRELAIVAEHRDKETSQKSVLGVARLSRGWGQSVAEFAVIVSDQWQGRGLGKKLVEQLIRIGRQEQICRIVGYILPDNFEMQALCQQMGFTIIRSFDEVTVQLELEGGQA
jgi:acetyltransferase